MEQYTLAPFAIGQRGFFMLLGFLVVSFYFVYLRLEQMEEINAARYVVIYEKLSVENKPLTETETSVKK